MRTRTRNRGVQTKNVVALAEAVKAGLSFQALRRFQERSQLGMAAIARVMRLPPRTLARRKRAGKLTSQESERLIRLERIFDQAVELFEGDEAAARDWLSAPVKGLGQQSPLVMAETEIGAREVENLIGRLEYGVFS